MISATILASRYSKKFRCSNIASVISPNVSFMLLRRAIAIKKNGTMMSTGTIQVKDLFLGVSTSSVSGFVFNSLISVRIFPIFGKVFTKKPFRRSNQMSSPVFPSTRTLFEIRTEYTAPRWIAKNESPIDGAILAVSDVASMITYQKYALLSVFSFLPRSTSSFHTMNTRQNTDDIIHAYSRCSKFQISLK